MQHKIKKPFFQRNSEVILLLAVIFIVVVAPYAVRGFTNHTISFGVDSYYHLDKARDIVEGRSLSANAIKAKESYIFNPYHYYMAGLIFIFGLGLAPLMSSLILTALFCWSLNRILSDRHTLNARYFSFGVLFSMPLTLNIFVSVHEYSLILALMSLSVLLSSRKSLTWQWLSLPLLFAVGLFGMIHAIIAIFLVLVLSDNKKILLKATIMAVIASSQFLLHLELLKETTIIAFLSEMPNQNFLTALLGLKGISAFSILLFIIGIGYTWDLRKKLAPYYLAFIGIILVSAFLDNKYLAYFAIGISIFAGYAFMKLYMRKWFFSSFKQFSIFIMMLGLLFSYVSFLRVAATEPPKIETMDGLEYLYDHYGPEAVVFSSPQVGQYAAFVGINPVLISNYKLISDSESRINDTKRIFNSNSLEEIKNLLSKYKVSHVLVTCQLQKEYGLNDDQGFMLMLTNNETFKNIYEDTSIQIWILNK